MSPGEITDMPDPSPAKPKRGPREPTTARRCGLCGKKRKLVKTDCCDQWICDDEDSYVMFSYARNSCSRNHRRYTLCGFHHGEEHAGAWQDCSSCREKFQTEMYVYYGTNDYNFTKLQDPPTFRPTKCKSCGAVIRLGEDGFSLLGGRYFCEDCSNEKRR